MIWRHTPVHTPVNSSSLVGPARPYALLNAAAWPAGRGRRSLPLLPPRYGRCTRPPRTGPLRPRAARSPRSGEGGAMLNGWRTPVQGDGVGWPDVLAIRGPRIVAVEFKVAPGRRSRCTGRLARSARGGGCRMSCLHRSRLPRPHRRVCSGERPTAGSVPAMALPTSRRPKDTRRACGRRPRRSACMGARRCRRASRSDCRVGHLAPVGAASHTQAAPTLGSICSLHGIGLLPGQVLPRASSLGVAWSLDRGGVHDAYEDRHALLVVYLDMLASMEAGGWCLVVKRRRGAASTAARLSGSSSTTARRTIRSRSV